MNKLSLTSVFTLLVLGLVGPLISTGFAANEDQPTIAGDSVQVTAWTNNFYRKNYDIWSWLPTISFRIDGPITSGSQLYVEFTQPGGGPWVKFDCPTQEVQKGYWRGIENCGGRENPEEKSSTYTGPVNFAIKMRNELAGTDTTLFTGKIKVAKALSNEEGPKAANHFVYYIDHDWNLPIGYIFYTPDRVHGWDYSMFNVAFWVRGEALHFDPHLFYQGKEVGKIYFDGEQIARPSCNAEVENGTTHYVSAAMPQKAKWARVACTFYSVKRWDKTDGGQSTAKEMFMLASNPGEYEVKVLWNNRLARSIKFTVAPEGRLDNGIASSNKLNIERVIVPVQIIGDQDGQWDKVSWKTDAFYGRALTGFTPPQ